MDWDRAAPLLNDKLDPKNVKPPKAFGPKGSYIEGWLAIAEANRIFGFGEWSYSLLNCACVFQGPREIGKEKKPGFGVTYTATVRVMVGEVSREDVGAGHGYDVDCGLAHESAIKEAVTDALKRALRTFGNPFGLALYDKSRENVGTPEGDAKGGKDAPKPEGGDSPDGPVFALIDRINAAMTLDALMAVWKERAAWSEAADSRAIAAKDARKAALQAPAPDRWPGDAAQRPINQTPY
jgi:DNA recombination protein Rad52